MPLTDAAWYRRGFFELIGSRRHSRPALHGMDVRLEQLLDRDEGVFLEAGARDGYTQSNTYYLERFRGWSGVLVEPVPGLRAKAEARRRRSQVFGCALVGPEAAAHGIATVGSVDVPARTIDDVLDEAGVGAVDLLVLDLGGGELDALRALDVERHPVDLLVIAMGDLAGRRRSFDGLLGDHFAFVGALSDTDALYRRRRWAGAQGLSRSASTASARARALRRAWREP